MVSVCRGGPGCPPFLSFLLRGVGPTRRGSFVSAKGPKTRGARAGPPEKPKVVILNAVKNLFFVGSRSLIESSFATLRTSATLRQSSPPYEMDGTGTQPRPQAPGPGRCHCSFRHARLDRASRVVGLPLFLTQCDKIVQNVQHVHIVQHVQNLTNCTKSDRTARTGWSSRAIGGPLRSATRLAAVRPGSRAAAPSGPAGCLPG